MTASAEAAVRDVAPWIEVLARVGYAAKAVLYGTIGLLAARAGLGWGGGRATHTRGAPEEVWAAGQRVTRTLPWATDGARSGVDVDDGRVELLGDIRERRHGWATRRQP